MQVHRAILGAALLLTLLFETVVGQVDGQLTDLRLREVRKIWDAGSHNAFTDLCRHHDEWLCVFREGTSHVSPDGVIRILASADGEQWVSRGALSMPDADLRDPKLSVTPSGEWMLTAAAAWHSPTAATHQTQAWFSRDGRTWDGPHAIGEPNLWLWRVTWHSDTAYGVSYDCGRDQFVRLEVSRDGRDFQPLVSRLFEEGYPNESGLVFAGDQAICLLRRDGEFPHGLVGTASAPFTEWTWRDLGIKLGGPQLLRLPDERYLAAVRLYEPSVRTALCWLDPAAGKLTEVLALPSGGDCSYAGLVWHAGEVWVSYYSSHEGKSAIYLAKVDVPAR